MRDVLTWNGRRWRAGWVVPLVLLALPNCAFHTNGLGGDKEVFEPGEMPRSSAIMCDIPKFSPDDGCAPGQSGIPLENAAVALAEGRNNSIGLDFSTSATTFCGAGIPKQMQFYGQFPDGKAVCLNCATQIPSKYPDGNAACAAKCVDLLTADGVEPPGGAQSWCDMNAHVSTNFDKHSCFPNACDNAGTPNMPFVDPRRKQEPIKWTDLLGGAGFDQNGDLTKSSGTGTPADPFDSGAASDAFHTIDHGDAWVEFGAAENNLSHVLAVSHWDGSSPDMTADLTDMGFAISLNYDGNVYILENGASTVVGPIMGYTKDERFRISIKDNNDGTAAITYWKLDGMCNPGTQCALIPLGTQTQPSPKYPLRISAAFREPGATLTGVTMVYIQKLP